MSIRMSSTKTYSILKMLFVILFMIMAVGAGHAVEADAQATRFAVIGDYGNAAPGVADVANLVNTWDVDFILTVGDNLYGSSRTYDEAVGQFYCDYLTDAGSGPFCPGGNSISNDFYPSMGNHDHLDLGGPDPYLNYFTLPGAGDLGSWTSGSERYYDFVRGPVHFFVLDSQGVVDSAAEEAAQKAWLESALAGSTSPWQVVYFHHSPYSSGENGSTREMRWPFAAWGVDAVISGHDHIYERLYANGIPYFVSGLGGTSAYPFDNPVPVSQASYNSGFGAMLVDADIDAMNIQFVNTAGMVIDAFTVSEPASPGIVDVWVEDSLDDVEQSLIEGAKYTNSSDFELGDDTEFFGEQAEGLRFRDIQIPQGATITSAYLEFVVDEVGDVPTVVDIRAQDIGDSPPFTETAYDLTDRPVTAVAAAWDIPAWNTVGEVHQSPDLSEVIQAVVNRSDWQAGNSMAIIINGTGMRTSEAWDGDPASVALLHIEYSVMPPPEAPSGLRAYAVSSSQINLWWRDNSEDEAGFLIERSMDEKIWEMVARTGPDRRWYRDGKLMADTTYFYRVSAFNDAGISEPSNVAHAKTRKDLSMHVSSLEAKAKNKRWYWKMKAKVTLEDNDGNPVRGAWVIGDWSRGVYGWRFCVTNAKGSCSLRAFSSMRNDTAVFKVRNAFHRTHTYDPDSNVVSSITIHKPK